MFFFDLLEAPLLERLPTPSELDSADGDGEATLTFNADADADAEADADADADADAGATPPEGTSGQQNVSVVV